jgi:hypothetical protein
MSTLSLHAGIAEDRLLGPYYLPPHLTGAVYHDFLLNFLPGAVARRGSADGINLWSMHGGAPAHFLLAFREFLNNVFPQQWIEQGKPAARPACSPNLNPLHFYFLRNLMSTLCAAEVSDVQDLQQQIQNRNELFVHNLEFSKESGSHCSDVQRPALKFKVNTLSTFSFIFKML